MDRENLENVRLKMLTCRNAYILVISNKNPVAYE
jgi:hypothetical protein